MSEWQCTIVYGVRNLVPDFQFGKAFHRSSALDVCYLQSRFAVLTRLSLFWDLRGSTVQSE